MLVLWLEKLNQIDSLCKIGIIYAWGGPRSIKRGEKWVKALKKDCFSLRWFSSNHEFLKRASSNREFLKRASSNREFLKRASSNQEFLKRASSNQEFPRWACLDEEGILQKIDLVDTEASQHFHTNILWRKFSPSGLIDLRYYSRLS